MKLSELLRGTNIFLPTYFEIYRRGEEEEETENIRLDRSVQSISVGSIISLL